MNRERTTSTTPATAASDAVAADGPARSLWFDPPSDDQDRRRQLTRERVVEEALTVIAQDGVEALTMRGLGARLWGKAVTYFNGTAIAPTTTTTTVAPTTTETPTTAAG